MRRPLRRLASACAVALLSCAHTKLEPPPVEQPSPVVLQKACDESHFDACQKLGELHREGKEVPKDLPAAEKLLRKACDGHELSACVELGKMYLAGTEVGRNIAFAAEVFSFACEGKDPEACMSLSEVIDMGLDALPFKAILARFNGHAPPEVESDAIEASEGLSRGQIADVLSKHERGIGFCITASEVSKPGALAVKFEVNAEGGAENGQVQGLDTADPTAIECITGQVRLWKFPAPDGGKRVTVTWRPKL